MRRYFLREHSHPHFLLPKTALSSIASPVPNLDTNESQETFNAARSLISLQLPSQDKANAVPCTTQPFKDIPLTIERLSPLTMPDLDPPYRNDNEPPSQYQPLSPSSSYYRTKGINGVLLTPRIPTIPDTDHENIYSKIPHIAL